MRGINRVTLLGNLGVDPDLQYTKRGIPVCNLRVVTNDVYTDGEGEQQAVAEWHNVTVWGSRGVQCDQQLVMSCTVYIEGRLESKRYNNKDGLHVRSWNVVADKVIFVTNKDDFEYVDEDDVVLAATP